MPVWIDDDEDACIRWLSIDRQPRVLLLNLEQVIDEPPGPGRVAGAEAAGAAVCAGAGAAAMDGTAGAEASAGAATGAGCGTSVTFFAR